MMALRSIREGMDCLVENVITHKWSHLEVGSRLNVKSKSIIIVEENVDTIFIIQECGMAS